jgi:TonB-linked SusC/RagA family outer membrane protein
MFSKTDNTDFLDTVTNDIAAFRNIVLFLSAIFVNFFITIYDVTAQELKISEKTSYNNHENLSDTNLIQNGIMTGYSKQIRSLITGSVSVIEQSSFKEVPSGNVPNQLQGLASGLSVIGNGQPGDISRIRIRGFSSFQNNDPLYIVDGVPIENISLLNPADVESVSILKDAGAAAIFGSRASNGVIIVTTKKGIKGMNIAFDMFTGIQLPGRGTKNKVLNTQEYADLQWRVYKNDGTVETHPIYGDSQNPTPDLPGWAANTDWYNAITHPAGIHNYDLTFSGGNDNALFYAGLGYFRQEGIVIYTDAEKYTARFNSEWTVLNGHIRVGENIAIAYLTGHSVGNLDESSPIQMGPYRSQSIIPVIWTGPDFVGLTHTYKAGDWGGIGIAPRLGNSSNVVANQTRNKDNNNWNARIVGNAFIDLKILQGLTFRSTLGGTFNNGYWMTYAFKTYENYENNVTNSFAEGAWYGNDWVATNTLTLDNTFGQNKILAVAGYEAVKYGIGRAVSGSRTGYFSDEVLYRTLSNGANIINASSIANTPTKLASAFIKTDYGFREKYIMSATFRRDGSSRFGKHELYGLFASFSAAWRLSDESFLKGIPWISDLKIRGSWGITGNQFAVSPLNAFFRFGGDPSSSYYDLNGTFNSSLQGFYPLQIANPDVKWEKSTSTDVGFESWLWKNKIGLTFDWYSRKCTDLLFNPELPGIAGDGDPPYVNIASMTNTGIDLELFYKEYWGPFGLQIGANLTSVKNNIDKIAQNIDFFYSGGSRIGSPVKNMVGHPMSSFFGYQVIGLFRESDFHTDFYTLVQNDGLPLQDGASPGFLKFRDTNKDGVITPDDRVFIGNPNPKFTYGINLELTYKNFDLTSFFYGLHGNDIFNYNKWWTDFWPSFNGQKSKDLLYNSWTITNQDAKVPKASNVSNFSTNTQICSYYIEDGSYLRLKTIQLGYTIPQKTADKLSIHSLRLYVQGVNFFTLTRYSGLDPEIGGEDRYFGIDYGNYPNVKQFIFGLNFTL